MVLGWVCQEYPLEPAQKSWVFFPGEDGKKAVGIGPCQIGGGNKGKETSVPPQANLAASGLGGVWPRSQLWLSLGKRPACQALADPAGAVGTVTSVPKVPLDAAGGYLRLEGPQKPLGKDADAADFRPVGGWG